MVSSNFLNNKNFKSDKAYSQISRKLVRMNSQHVKENNMILSSIILNKIVQLMRAKDRDFDVMFERVKFGGSFYKNLKVSDPNEYDLHFVVKLPIGYNLLKIEPDHATPGYVKIRVLDKNFSGHENFMNKILDGDYLDQNKFRSWIQRVVDRALLEFRQVTNENEYVIMTRKKKSLFKLKYSQSGPAFTINVMRLNDQRELSFDLVPCLLFRDDRYLPGFRPHEEEWFTIAKPLTSPLNRPYAGDYTQLLWRAGFYDDEKNILSGQIKPIIRIIKKLRDIKQWHQLKSYFIETLFLHELKDPNFANNWERASRTNILMHMLCVLQRKLAAGVLTSYWHEGLNTLDDLPRLREIANELQSIINRIDDNIKGDKDILLTIFNLR